MITDLDKIIVPDSKIIKDAQTSSMNTAMN